MSGELLREAMARARRLLCPDAERERGPDPYPVEALGPMADVCRAIAEGAQVQPALVGQSLMATAALLVSGLWNTRHIDGSVKPLTLYCLSVALSGSGKDVADGIVTAALRDWQRGANEDYQAARSAYEAALSSRKKGELPPVAPHRLCADLTVEGLRRAYHEGVASQGVFSTEAAAVLAGYGFSAEQRVKTAATLCSLWDRGHLSVLRASGGRFERYGLRLSAHLLVQPTAVADVLTDPLLANIGLWPRFLLAWPPVNPPRRFAPWDAARDPHVGAFWRKCTELLEQDVPPDCTDNGLLRLSDEAARAFGAFFESMEQAAQADLQQVRAFALRATEQAVRIAAVLTAWRGLAVVQEDDAHRGCTLARYHVEQWQAALLDGKADPAVDRTLALYRWLCEQPDRGARRRDIVRSGPRSLRDASVRDEVIDRLIAVGLAYWGDGGRLCAEVSPRVATVSPPRGDTKHQKNQRLTQSVAAVAAVAGGGVEEFLGEDVV